MANIEYSRLLMKRSMTAGVVPTVPLTNNLNDFNATDIFEGELFYNVADGILYSRDLTGIVILATGVVPVNPDLTTVLGIGNNTGPFDIIIDTDQVVRNPLGLSPLESTLSFGTSAVPGVSDNHIELVSQNTTAGQFSGLFLQSQDPSNIANAQLTLLDGLGSIVSIGINTDLLGGCQPLTAFDAGTNASFAHNLTPAGAFHGFNCTNAVSQAAVWNQQPTQLDWTINDPVANLTVTEVNDYITGSRRDVVSSLGTSTVIQDYNGDIFLTSSKSIELTATTNVDITTGFTTIDGQFAAFTNNVGFYIDTLPAFADDAAAALGGVLTNQVYQTDGTGAAPLNVPGIVMIKQ